LWSSRFETKASVCPSGDHDGDSLEPFAKNAASAGFDPSIGTIQMRRSFTNATRPVRGATTGSSPSARSFGAPPLAETGQTCIFGCAGLPVGLGSKLPSAGQLAPWSPPRTYTIV